MIPFIFFFFPSFLSSTHVLYFFSFLFSLFFPLVFSPPHTYLPLFSFYYFPLLQSITSSKLRVFQFSFFLFFFFFSPFSLITSFLPLLKIYPYSFLFFFPSFLFFSFTLFCSLFFPEHSTNSQSSPSIILFFFFLAHCL